MTTARPNHAVLDPTSERVPATRNAAGRLGTLSGKTIALLDISKPRGNVFLDAVESRLAEHGANVKRYRKPTFTKPAPVDLRAQIRAECDAVIEALAD